MAPRALQRAGELADGVLAMEVTPEELRVAGDTARQGAVDAGRDPASLSVGVLLPTLVTEGPVTWLAIRDLLWYQAWKYGDLTAARDPDGALRTPGPMTAEEDAWLRRTSVTGTPEQVAALIQEYADAAGGQLHFLARSYLPGQDAAQRAAALDGLAEVRTLLPKRVTAVEQPD